MMAENNKRMIRNTGMLFLRMLFAMGVTLYTSRVVLDVLGAEDFGLYHVVAGFVLILGFLQGAMTAATQRFFAFELGEAVDARLSEVFSTSLNIHVILALLIMAVAETGGLWFVTTQLTIPIERMNAALWVYHLSVVSFGLSVLIVPFTAMIIAHERMGVFALVSIIDVSLKLLAVIALQYSGSDKLVSYAMLMLAVALATFCIYIIYHVKAFKLVCYRFYWDGPKFRAMLSYTAWNIWGNLAAVMSGQGTNVLLNITFGPSINAARAIAFQANTALTSFTQSVQAAINPQIIKLYAANNLKQMHSLVLMGAKFNFFLLFLLSYPVMLEAEALLSLWLVEVPAYSVIFLKLIVINSLIDSISGPLMTSAQATGRIRLYQAVVGGFLMLNLPFSYFFLKWGYEPYVVVVISICLAIAALISRLIIITPLIKLPAALFLKSVIVRCFLVAVASVPPSTILKFDSASSLSELIFSVLFSLSIGTLIILLFGLSSKERCYLAKMAKKIKYGIKNLC